MKDTLFMGCGTALVTPFREDFSVDYEAYVQHVERQVAEGADFLVPLATTGETPTLSTEEKLTLLRLTHEHAHGLKLLAGCGTNSVDATLANMELLEQFAPHAYLVVVPYYNKPTQEGQYKYFRTIAERTQKLIVIYNVPGRTGANMTADTCAALAHDCPNIIGIKEASGNYDQMSEIIRKVPESFSVLSGDDNLTLAMMATGGDGVISVASNLAPDLVSGMVHAMSEGDLEKARALHHRLFPLFKACFVESNPIPVKAALSLRGFMSDVVRLPLSSATEKTKELMSEIISELWK